MRGLWHQIINEGWYAIRTIEREELQDNNNNNDDDEEEEEEEQQQQQEIQDSNNRQLTDGMEQPNQDKIRKENRKPTNTWGYWKLAPSNQRGWKKKLRKNISEESKSYWRQNYIAETLSKE